MSGTAKGFTEREKSSPDVARTGRDSFLHPSGKSYTEHSKSSSDVARAGRSDGQGQPGHSKGIRGGADKGADGVSRIADDISPA